MGEGSSRGGSFVLRNNGWIDIEMVKILSSVRLLKAELEAQGRKSKSWTSAAGRVIGGKPFSRGALYLMLRNRTALSRQRRRYASRAKTGQASCGCDSAFPLRGSIGSEFSQRGSGDEMALKIEGIVDGGMHTQEALRRARRLESLHLALSPSHRLMRVLGSIVAPDPLFVRAAQP